MRRITWPMRRGHFPPHIWNPWPRFAYSLCNFYGATIIIIIRKFITRTCSQALSMNRRRGLRQMELLAKTVYGPVLKIRQRSAHAQNHVSVQRCCKSFTTIVLGDNHFPLTGSNFGNLTAFRAIYSHIFTAHAQERPLMNFRLKFWHHHSIPWSRFPYRARYFRDLRTFSVDFCIR